MSLVAKVCGVAKANIAKIMGVAADPFQIEVTVIEGESYTYQFYLESPSNLVVDWGDGSSDTYSSTAYPSHTYSLPGRKTVTFKSGTAARIRLGDSSGGGTPTMVTKILTAVPAWLGLTSAARMFRGCTNITYWAPGFLNAASANMTSMLYAFADLPAFNEDLSGLNVSKVTDFSYTFYGDTLFNSNISGWAVGTAATNMSYMLYGCAAFNRSLSSWTPSNVTNIGYMLYGCSAFNSALFTSTGNVTDAQRFLALCTSFNHSSINSMDVSKVQNFTSFLSGATSFNQAVNSLVTSAATNISYMFYNCAAFDQDISSLDVADVTNATAMLQGSGFTQTNYDLLLNINTGWPSQNVQNSVAFHAGTAKYDNENADVANGRAHLATDHSWTITDGGPD
jgi:hypothetical protein